MQTPEEIQHVDKASFSAEEDNWDYNKIQSISNTKRKREDFFHATLLVNDVPIKFIIDSGSPVTPIHQRLFNDASEVTKLNTSYKDVNDNKFEFRGQTTATVKTNKMTIQLPLLITKANITPSMGLDGMNRLGIALNTTSEDIKIHNIKLDKTEKKILKLKNEFKDHLPQHHRIEKLIGKDKPKRRRKNNTTERQTKSATLTRPGSRRNQTTNKKRLLGKSNRNKRNLLREPSSYHSEKEQIGKNCTGLKKNKRSNDTEKGPNAKYGRIDIKNITQNIRRKRGRDIANKNALRLCIRSNQTG